MLRTSRHSPPRTDLLACFLAAAVLGGAAAQAQGPSQAEIENFLDSGWGQSNGLPAQTQAPPAFQSPAFNQFMQGQPQSPLRLPQGRNFPAFPSQGAGGTRMPAGLPGRLTPLDVFRIMFGGGSAPGSPQDQSGNNNAIYGAQEQLQVARDQAAQAESAASRAQYGSTSSERQSAAGEAQDHANAARAAADSATSRAGGGPSAAQDAAAQARNEAARAQSAADRARANAAGAGW